MSGWGLSSCPAPTDQKGFGRFFWVLASRPRVGSLQTRSQQKAEKCNKTFDHSSFSSPRAGSEKSRQPSPLPPQASGLTFLSLPIAAPKNAGVTRHKGSTQPPDFAPSSGEAAAGPFP